MQLRTFDRPSARSATLLLFGLALTHVVLHLLTNGNYGIFRDELYYIACSDHLAWGYVDHPPLSIAALAVTRRVLGESFYAVRIPLALAGGFALFLSGRLARRFGGGPAAQWIAGLAYLAAPVPLVMFGFFSMNGFDLLFWIVCSLIAARLLAGGDERLWVALGVTVGLGLLNKYSVGFFAFAFIVGVLLTPERRRLWSFWPLIGGAVAGVIFLPHILWEITNGLPSLEFIRTAQAEKIMPMSPLQFVGAQVIEGNPFLAPIWVIGLGGLLLSRALRLYRALGWTYLVLLLLFIVQQGKPYYLAPSYPFLLAAGAVMLEQWTAAWSIARVGLACWLVVGSVALLPMGLPLLSPPVFLRYAEAIGIKPPSSERSHATAILPQHFSDRFGWENMVRTVADVYNSLPPPDRARAAILGGNYGEAAAIDYFGPGLGLPKAISGHNNYWIWGYGETTGDVLVAVGVRRETLDQFCGSVEQVATVISPYAMPYETNLPVHVCRGLKIPMAEAWPLLKRYI